VNILPSCSLLEFIDRWPRGLFFEAVDECKEILRMLLEEEPDLNQRSDDEHQRTALLVACGRGNHAAIEILLAAGADPGCTDSQGSGPLQYLTNYAWRSQTDCLFSIYMLIRCRADIDCMGQGPEAETPLSWLCMYGGNRLHVVTLLLESGADPNKPNHKGETPLIHAARSDRPDLLQTLLMFGANPDRRDQRGMTALDHARKKDRKEAVQVLEKNSGESRTRAVQVMEKPFELRLLY
jgi:ankyrin repeat protein